MFNFTKIFGVAGAVMVFTGLAYGQAAVSCNTATVSVDQGNVIVRAEGQAEQVSNVTFTCNNTGAAVANLTVTDNVSAAITSKALGTTGYTEAVLVAGGVPVSQGQLNGTNQLTFAVSLATGLTTFTVTNVRVNASATTGTITEMLSGITSSASGPAVITPITTAPVSVGTPLPGLTNVKLVTSSVPTNLVLCTAYTPAQQTGAMSLSFTEGFGDAFKSAGTAGTNGVLASNFTGNTESGFVPAGAFPTAGAAAANVANSGTKVKVTFANVPAGVTLYVPLSVPSGQGTLTLVASETSSTPATAATGLPLVGTVALTGGAGTAVYEYSTATLATSISTSESFTIPVTFSVAANTVPLNATGFTAAVSLAPVNAAPGTTIPSFVAGTAPAVTGPTFAPCSTTLLFPYAVNTFGYDTGMAISNTSTGAGATPQSGTCTLNFYGTGAPASGSAVTASIASGTTYAQSVSNLAPGFQGYVIATCQFQYAHGFAFISSGLGSSAGIAEGYLALVVPSRTAGTGTETLSQ